MQTDAPDLDIHWVGTWASAQQRTEPQNMPPEPGLAGNTLRQVVHVSLGGAQVRVRFSNESGSGPLTLLAVHIARSAGKRVIQPETDIALTFDGLAPLRIPPGEFRFSDPVDFDLTPLSDVAVSIYFGDVPETVSGHPGSRTTSYLAAGNAVSSPEGLAFTTTFAQWYVLSGIDVLAPGSAGAIVILGDSITDGRGVTTDRNCRWPDHLARRLQADPGTAGVAVLNLGIGGNRVLHDGLGPSALARFDRDVLGQSGVRWLIVLEGVNDIGTGPADPQGEVASEIIAAFTHFAASARARGIRVYGATLLPFGDSFYSTPGREAERQAINAWIRSGGVLDGVIDMDAALRDPQEQLRLRAEADSGDFLHPEDEGYRLMADAVELSLFTI